MNSKSFLKARRSEDRIRSLTCEKDELETALRAAEKALQEEKDISRALEFKLASSSKPSQDSSILRREISQIQIDNAELSLKYSVAKATVQSKENSELNHKVSKYKMIESMCKELEDARVLVDKENQDLKREFNVQAEQQMKNQREYSCLLYTSPSPRDS